MIVDGRNSKNQTLQKYGSISLSNFYFLAKVLFLLYAAIMNCLKDNPTDYIGPDSLFSFCHITLLIKSN